MRYITEPVDTLEHDGLSFAVRHEPDFDAGKPWEEEDGHGPVREVRYNYTGHPDKRPGERVMFSDYMRYAYVYDIAGAMKIAKRDGWGLDDSARAQLVHRLKREPTAGEVIAEAVERDFDRLRRFCDDQWSYVGVVVTLLDAEGDETGEEESIWRVESDCEDYLEELAVELADAIVDRVGDAEVITHTHRATTIEHRIR